MSELEHDHRDENEIVGENKYWCNHCDITFSEPRKNNEGEFNQPCPECGSEIEPTEIISFLSQGYYDNPKTDQDFIQIAIDVYGSAVRDNNRASLIELGKEYHETGEADI